MNCVPEKPHYTSERSEQQILWLSSRKPVFVIASKVVLGRPWHHGIWADRRTQFSLSDSLSSCLLSNYAIYESIET